MDYFLFNFSGVQFHYTMSLLYILYFNNYYKEENVKDFCHKGHFFDIDVNSACSKVKPLLTVCVIKRQHKIHQKKSIFCGH